MPLLDASELIGDPDFTQKIMVQRRLLSEDDKGRTSAAASPPFEIEAIVYPASGSRLVPSPEGTMESGDIMVVTKTRLTEGSGQADADIVTIGGLRYTVFNTNDFSAFGAGFIVATCRQNRLNA